MCPRKGGRGKDTMKSFPCSSEAREKSRAKKITEARRVGAPRWSSEPSGARRANTLTIFFEIRSNFVKNVHQTTNAYSFYYCHVYPKY